MFRAINDTLEKWASFMSRLIRDTLKLWFGFGVVLSGSQVRRYNRLKRKASKDAKRINWLNNRLVELNHDVLLYKEETQKALDEIKQLREDLLCRKLEVDRLKTTNTNLRKAMGISQ